MYPLAGIHSILLKGSVENSGKAAEQLAENDTISDQLYKYKKGKRK